MISPELESKISQMVEFLGFVLYDVAFLKENDSNILRISITHFSDPISLESCQKVSEALSPMLDVELDLDFSYFLEVGSKGLERSLKTSRHFALSLQERVNLKLDDKSSLEGILEDFKDNIIKLRLDNNEIVELPLSRIKKAKTILEW